MTMLQNDLNRRPGNLRWALIGVLLGLPIPIVILMWLFLNY
jgi:hypothetical protein